ncbi:MAG: matrixin family metalloprotease [Planctomycetota bacterium]|jgi:hypothetical protein
MRARWIAVTLAVMLLATQMLAHSASAGGGAKGKQRLLSKITFIHHKKGHLKPPWAGGGGDKKPKEGYYTYISKGAKWRVTEDLRLNLTAEENVNGSLDGVIYDAVAASMDEWETAARAAVFGGLVLDASATYSGGAYRGHNTVSFGSYGDPRVIGVTTVWGYFSGPPRTREIVEAHVLLNDHFEWGDASADGDGDGDPDSFLMDIENIAIHELGHVAGMGDVYQPEAGEETMYGYSTEGELKKRDLYKGDITGIRKLY